MKKKLLSILCVMAFALNMSACNKTEGVQQTVFEAQTETSAISVEIKSSKTDTALETSDETTSDVIEAAAEETTTVSTTAVTVEESVTVQTTSESTETTVNAAPEPTETKTAKTTFADA